MNIYLALIIIVSILLAIGIFVYFFQEKFIFQAEKLHKDFQFAYNNLNAEEKLVETEPNVFIDYLHFKTNEKCKGLVFYLKGNTKSIKGWGKFAIDFTRLGYDVIMLDYRGFGKSTGRRSSDGMKRDIQFVYNIARKLCDETKIIIYGRSLGSGYAARLASQNNPKMLILASPIYSLISAIHRYLPFMPAKPFMRYNLPTHKYLKSVICPIRIIHGSNDKLVPLKSVVNLSKVNPSKTRLYTILEAGHINIHQYEEYHKVIEEILEGKAVNIDLAQTSMFTNHRK